MVRFPSCSDVHEYNDKSRSTHPELVPASAKVYVCSNDLTLAIVDKSTVQKYTNSDRYIQMFISMIQMDLSTMFPSFP